MSVRAMVSKCSKCGRLISWNPAVGHILCERCEKKLRRKTTLNKKHKTQK